VAHTYKVGGREGRNVPAIKIASLCELSASGLYTFMIKMSGKEAALLSPPPLRTRRASFPAARSSLSNALFGDAARRLHDTRLEPTDVSVNLPPVDGGRFISASGAAPTEFSVIICFSPLVGLPDSLVRKDQKEVCPLSRGVMSPKAQLLSIPLQNGIRFFPHPLPAPLSICLTAYLPRGSDTGLPCSACLPEWVRSSLSAGDRLSTTGKS
jgi:hypothetical protein